jgi:hypothetical protein
MSILDISMTTLGVMSYGVGRLVGKSSQLISPNPTWTILANVVNTAHHQKDIENLSKRSAIRIERDGIGKEYHSKVIINGVHIGDLPDTGVNPIAKVLYDNYKRGKVIHPRQWVRVNNGRRLEVFIQIDIDK